jgi:hypothetical protein
MYINKKIYIYIHIYTFLPLKSQFLFYENTANLLYHFNL